MSHREHFEGVESSVVSGDQISVLRDHDTQTYRVFVHKGYRKVRIGNHLGTAFQFDSCECCDLSIEDVKQLAASIDRAIRTHEPWPIYSEDKT